MNDDVYVKLREFLDTLPNGYPATQSGVELQILRKLFTPEDARTVPLLGPEPESAETIAPRMGVSATEAEKALDSMAQRGLIYRLREGDRKRYAAIQYLVGFWEFQLKTLTRELLDLEDEYFGQYLLFRKATPTTQMRVIPVGTALQSTATVATYHDIRELVKNKSLIAVQECICRKAQGLRGSSCDRPAERCIAFDQMAQYCIDRGAARPIGQDELAGLLAMGEEQALVPSPNNAQDLSFLCMCCSCCCTLLRASKFLPRPAEMIPSAFQAKVDAERCTACGICVERCQMEALKDEGRVYAVDDGRCIGCGLCIAKCPEEAICLQPRPVVVPVPADYFDTHRWILREQAPAPVG